MERFIHCRVSLEINNGQMKSLDTSDVKLFTVKVKPKWMGWWITPLQCMHFEKNAFAKLF